jgi:hypothetical protein
MIQPSDNTSQSALQTALQSKHANVVKALALYSSGNLGEYSKFVLTLSCAEQLTIKAFMSEADGMIGF